MDSNRRNLIVGLGVLSAGTLAPSLTKSTGRAVAMTATAPRAGISLDAPIAKADKAITIAAFGNARMVADWTSPTVKGTDIDTGAVFQNGFDALGRETVSAIPSNAGFLSWPDQNGSQLTMIAIDGSPIMSAAGIVPRFATAIRKGRDAQEVVCRKCALLFGRLDDLRGGHPGGHAFVRPNRNGSSRPTSSWAAIAPASHRLLT